MALPSTYRTAAQEVGSIVVCHRYACSALTADLLHCLAWPGWPVPAEAAPHVSRCYLSSPMGSQDERA